ncbi:murein hydrolase activator NlpD [Xenorhabdus sp. XENO-10]|uniref:Murein hydrolase activator NlpD n=1 Tax=Xenorhabdus yunnanensis TaxID=3025878 RepID=A0ABT5LIC0_9GAMM|nr:murein hydrolase activator NlpD [Xenorhabdus yunnanensis]MDC9590858.1 murein hydrolase activator NlpD [Xenorhabdus yunnanensis]
MNIENPVKKIKWIITSTVMGVVLVGCSNTPNRPAPIVNIDNKEKNGELFSRPSSISTPMPSSAPPILTNRASDNHAARNRQLVNDAANSRSSQGKIVYNRNYGNIPKGSYNGNTYTVKHGDTLFYIAWITGDDFRDIAHKNSILEPYSLNVGQVLRIGNATSKNGVLIASNSTQSEIKQVDFQKINAYPANIDRPRSEKMLPRATISVRDSAASKVSTATDTEINSAINDISAINSWRWPAEGKILEGFSDSQGGNKGIDIAGSRGQPVFATARGKVVYAGNALRGYGNLIIIKHNDDYLSAYAHNDTMLVREQQDVQAGQKIAAMGSSGTSSVRLHFEIRYKGKSVNPLRYLPQR